MLKWMKFSDKMHEKNAMTEKNDMNDMDEMNDVNWWMKWISKSTKWN